MGVEEWQKNASSAETGPRGGGKGCMWVFMARKIVCGQPLLLGCRSLSLVRACCVVWGWLSSRRDGRDHCAERGVGERKIVKKRHEAKELSL